MLVDRKVVVQPGVDIGGMTKVLNSDFEQGIQYTTLNIYMV